MEKIKAAGGVVWRYKGESVQVLLIYRNGVWDLPKGKLEGEESLRDCAVREVAEETGSKNEPEAEDSLGTTTHHYKENESTIEKETHWWRMSFKGDQSGFVPQKNEGIEEVKWTDFSKAIRFVGYENLKDVLNRFNKTLK